MATSKGRFRSVRKKKGNNDVTSPQSFPNHTTNRSLLNIYNNSPHQRTPSQSVMVRLKRLDTLRLNQRIKVKDYGYGTISFLGCVHFAQGLFVGVELDTMRGKHDGMYHGKRYFTAKPNHGVLVKQHRVELLDIDAPINQSSVSDLNLDNIFSDDNDLYTPSNDKLSHKDISNFLFNNDNKEQIEKDKIQYDADQKKILDLKAKNNQLKIELEEKMSSVDKLEVSISSLKKRGQELKKEKEDFEHEMNSKLEILQDQLKQIRNQLITKDDVLKERINIHQNTQNKYQKKIKEHENLKIKNIETKHIIYYGVYNDNNNNNKDDLIQKTRNKTQNKLQIVNNYKDQLNQRKIKSQQKLNKQIKDWLFDYGQKPQM